MINRRKVHFYAPFELIREVVHKEGIEKRGFYSVGVLLGNIWSGIKRRLGKIRDFFTYSYRIGRESEVLYHYYLRPDKSGALKKVIPPKIDERKEELIKDISISITSNNLEND